MVVVYEKLSSKNQLQWTGQGYHSYQMPLALEIAYMLSLNLVTTN